MYLADDENARDEKPSWAERVAEVLRRIFVPAPEPVPVPVVVHPGIGIRRPRA